MKVKTLKSLALLVRDTRDWVGEALQLNIHGFCCTRTVNRLTSDFTYNL